MQYIIRPLTPERIPDYLDFFDNRAFTDNQYWKSCYCTYYQLRGEVKERFKPASFSMKKKNWEVAVEMIREGIIRGYLFYVEGMVVGWCNANDKTMFPTLKATEPAGEILAVMCFVIAPGFRGKGVASCLLDYCLDDARKRGFKAIEGRASKTAKTSAGQYHGPRGLYEKLGFMKIGEKRGQLIFQLKM